MKFWGLLSLLILVGCNSEIGGMSSIQGIANPNNPVPEVVYIGGPAAAIYTVGSELDFSVTFSEPVEVLGLPHLNLSFDSGNVSATYLSGSGTNTLLFRKTIVAGEYEIEGVATTNALSLNGGSIVSIMDFDQSKLTFTRFDFPGVQVNAAVASFVTLTPPANGLYNDVTDLCFDLEYSAPVTIDSPALYVPLTIGGNSYQATISSGSGTTDLRFCYDIPPGIQAMGVTVGSTLMGAGLNDAFGIPVSLNITSSSFPSVGIDSIAPALSGITEPALRTHYINENVDFLLAFSEQVIVTGGTPRISFSLGGQTKYASYAGMYDSVTPIFRYTVASGDPDGIQVTSPSGTIDFRGATIADIAGNVLPAATPLSYDPLTNLKIDGTPPTRVGSPFMISSSGTYGNGDTISIAIQYSSDIYMTGTPYIELRIDGQIKRANLVTSAPTQVLVFQYDVEPILKDLSGIEVLSPIHLNGGTLKDGSIAQANDAPLTFTSFNKPDHLVNSFTTITSASINSDSNTSIEGIGGYKPGQTVEIKIVFSDTVDVDTVGGTPSIDFDMDGTNKSLTWQSGSGTNTHTFAYTVQNSDFDMTGIIIEDALSLNGATMLDSSGNAIDPELPSSFSGLKEIYLIPTELGYWFDFDDQSYITVDGTNRITSIRSKADPINADSYSSMALPERYDEGLARGIRFQDSVPLTFSGSAIAMTNFVSVYHGGAVGQRLFEFNSYFHQKEANYSVRTDCAFCRHFEDNAWQNSFNLFSLFYLGNGYQWAPIKRLISMDGISGADYLKLGRDFSGGVIYEVVIFSSTPSQATLDKVHDYLAIKHQVNFDGPATVDATGI